jgi:flagellar FliL protein
MAEKKLALPANGKDEGKTTGRMSLAQNAIGFAVAGLIAAGVGAFHGLQAKPPGDPPKLGGAPPSARFLDRSGEEKKFAPIVEMGTLDLAPVVTNLASPSDIWVRVEGVLLFEGKTLPHGEALAGQIAGDILAFMRTQTLQQIQGVAGLQHLRQDLTERVVTRSEGHVREFIIKSLVVQ